MSTEIGGVSESLISGAHTSVINYLVRVIILYALRAKYPYLDYKRVRLSRSRYEDTKRYEDI